MRNEVFCQIMGQTKLINSRHQGTIHGLNFLTKTFIKYHVHS